MSMREKNLLGQLLVDKKIISPDQLEEALAKQKEIGGMIGSVLIKMGYIDEETVFLPILAEQLKVDFINLKNITIPPDIIKRVPAKIAVHYKIIPFEFDSRMLSIATSHPLDVHTLDEISLGVKSSLRPVLAGQKDILDAIRKYYGVGAETIDQMMDQVDDQAPFETIADVEEIESEASISKFLNQIFLEAYRDRATDIHIEPFENQLQIRYRVDGVLYDANVPPNIKHFKDSIISRIKILSHLNIAEKRMPQDGRFKIRVGDIDMDIRVSFLPTPFGESVVLRLLNTTRLFRLSQLGLNEKESGILEALIKKPNGIIFLTGPTGSGKTTTLYSCLSSINTEDKKIITIEDPIEYQLKGITQVQINPGVGLSFAKGLRSMLRHDPDVMMIGEVRDIETAEIAIQIALTGHLIFSTLHTNNAASGVTRLMDMGIQPYLIMSTVKCFIAQRLVRTICPRCKVESGNQPSTFFDEAPEGKDIIFYEGKGCESCNFTGYLGRTSIFEFLLVTDAIRKLILQQADAEQIKEMAIKQGMMTLNQAGMQKVREGVTTVQEVLRVTQEE